MKLHDLYHTHGGGPGRMRAKDAEERSALWTDASRTNFGDGTSKNQSTTVRLRVERSSLLTWDRFCTL